MAYSVWQNRKNRDFKSQKGKEEMAYKEKDLDESRKFIQSVNIHNGAGLTIDELQGMLQNQCDENGIPVKFRRDTLKTGSLFNPQSEEVLVVSNPEHTEYNSFVVRLRHMGTHAFMDVYASGYSINLARTNSDIPGHRLFNAIVGTKKKMLNENTYYEILANCFENLFE